MRNREGRGAQRPHNLDSRNTRVSSGSEAPGSHQGQPSVDIGPDAAPYDANKYKCHHIVRGPSIIPGRIQGLPAVGRLQRVEGIYSGPDGRIIEVGYRAKARIEVEGPIGDPG